MAAQSPHILNPGKPRRPVVTGHDIPAGTERKAPITSSPNAAAAPGAIARYQTGCGRMSPEETELYGADMNKSMI